MADLSPFTQVVMDHLWESLVSVVAAARHEQPPFPLAVEAPVFTRRATGGWVTQGGKLVGSRYRFVELDDNTEFRVSNTGRVWISGRTCPGGSRVDFTKLVFVHDLVMLSTSVLRPLDENGKEMVVMHGGPGLVPDAERRDADGYERNFAEDLRWATQGEFAEYLTGETARTVAVLTAVLAPTIQLQAVTEATVEATVEAATEAAIEAAIEASPLVGKPKRVVKSRKRI